MRVLSAKEAREQLDLNIKYKWLDYIFRTIQERIDIEKCFMQLMHDPLNPYTDIPIEHLEQLKELGYAVEYCRAVSEECFLDKNSNYIDSNRPLVRGNYYGFSAKNPHEPLMCWKISW